jgi:hypothetical protein
MNNMDQIKIKMAVNPGAHEQHGPNKIKLGVKSDAHEQHEPNQHKTGGEPMCS